MKKNSSTQGLRGVAVRRLATAGLALVTAVAVGGCGLIKIGYRNGDTVGVFWLDRYLDLTGDQKDFVKPRLHQLLAWHKATQLPDYATFAQDLQKQSMQSISAVDVATFGNQARARAMTTVDHALPDLADLALQLTPDNIDAIKKKFANDDTKWRDEFMKGEVDDQRKARYEKSLERVEEWYGRFNTQQRAMIRELSDARPMNNDVLLAERQRRERELASLLAKVVRDKPPRDAVIAMMKAYADRFDHDPDPERRAYMESWRHATEEMDAGVHNLSTPQQRLRASGKLQDWIDDFRSLAGDPG